MNALQDLEQIKQQWQAQSTTGPDLAALRERIAAENRSQRRTLGLVGLGTLVVLVLTFTQALADQPHHGLVQLRVHGRICGTGMADSTVAVPRHVAAQ